MPVVKQGLGKWILSGANTYKGDTTVNGGTLAVDGNQTFNRFTANHQLTVNSGATSSKRQISLSSEGLPEGQYHVLWTDTSVNGYLSVP